MSHEGLLDLAVSVAVEAGALAVRMREGGIGVAATKSSPVDVVTEADRAVERLVRDRLAEARPDDAFLGEEGDDVAGSSGVTWVVDPIDGTVNYLYGSTEWAVSIAAQVDGMSVAGVVHAPVTGDLFTAVADGDAWSNGRPIQVRTVPPLAEAMVLTGFGYDAALRAHQGAAVAAMLPRVRDIRRRGSCALDLCAIAAGQADAYVEEGPHLWDHAAGGLIATRAGARVEVVPTVRGDDLIVAAPADGFDAFRALVRDCGF